MDVMDAGQLKSIRSMKRLGSLKKSQETAMMSIWAMSFKRFDKGRNTPCSLQKCQIWVGLRLRPVPTSELIGFLDPRSSNPPILDYETGLLCVMCTWSLLEHHLNWRQAQWAQLTRSLQKSRLLNHRRHVRRLLPAACYQLPASAGIANSM